MVILSRVIQAWQKLAVAGAISIGMVLIAPVLGISARPTMLIPVGVMVGFAAVVMKREERNTIAPWGRQQSWWQLLVGVFFTFATLGPIVVLSVSTPRTPGHGLVAALYSGLVALGWTSLSITRKWWLIPVMLTAQMVFTNAIFQWSGTLGLLSIGDEWSERVRLAILALISTAMMILGYVFTLRFVRSITARATIAGAELEMARKIHERIVPPVQSDFGIAEVFGRSHPSSEMGGDLIDVSMRDGIVEVYLADVSGHGVKAGLVMGMVKSAIRMRQRSTPSLDVLVSDLNAVLADLMMADMFATLACVRISKVSGSVRAEYALAGHWPILHVSAQGQLTELPNEHLPLGVDGEELFQSGVVELRSGDLLALMTDGLIEVQNSGGKELGFGVFKDLITRERARPLAELHDAVIGIARQHGKQLDDQSLVLVRVG